MNTEPCKLHEGAHHYERCACGHQYCPHFWGACPRCAEGGDRTELGQHSALVNALNTALSRRRASRPMAELPTIYWESIGGDWYRLKDYKTLDVIGSIRRVKGFHGFRTEARRNGSIETREFSTTLAASEWVEGALVAPAGGAR